MKKKKGLTQSQLKNKLQIIFNEYIRLRDAGKPCISCGKVTRLQAGHYFSVKGYDGLRFDEDNVHGECEYCNCWNESHLIMYGINLRRKIGIERYKRLLLKSIDYKKNGNKFYKHELLEMIETYKKKVADLKNNQNK